MGVFQSVDTPRLRFKIPSKSTLELVLTKTTQKNLKHASFWCVIEYDVLGVKQGALTSREVIFSVTKSGYILRRFIGDKLKILSEIFSTDVLIQI